MNTRFYSAFLHYFNKFSLLVLSGVNKTEEIFLVATVFRKFNVIPAGF
jgi:hypothetical protein